MKLQWHIRDGDDDLPTVEGWYRVMISGDSETEGPHVYYAYDDYETWAEFFPDEEEGGPGTFHGNRDEETDQVFAWCGPMPFVPYKTATMPALRWIIWPEGKQDQAREANGKWHARWVAFVMGLADLRHPSDTRRITTLITRDGRRAVDLAHSHDRTGWFGR